MDESPSSRRRCSVCSQSIPDRPYQAKTARACSPVCARRLAVQEHPDIEIRSLHLLNQQNEPETVGGNHEDHED